MNKPTQEKERLLDETIQLMHTEAHCAAIYLRGTCEAIDTPFAHDKWLTISQEYMLFFLHVIERALSDHVPDEERQQFTNDMEEKLLDKLDKTYFDHSDKERDQLIEEYWDTVKRRKATYADYKVHKDGESMTKVGNLYWEFSKHIATILSGGPSLILVEAATKKVVDGLQRINMQEIYQEEAMESIDNIIEDMKNYEFKKEEWIDDSKPIVKEEFEKIWDTFSHTANNEGELDNLMEVRNPIVFEALYEAAEKILSVMSPKNSDHIMQEVLEGRWEWFIEEYLNAMRTGYYIKLVKEKIECNKIRKTTDYEIKLPSFIDKMFGQKIYKPSSLEYSLCEYYSQTIRHALSEEKPGLSKEQLNEIKYHIFVAAMYGLNAYAIEDMWKEI